MVFQLHKNPVLRRELQKRAISIFGAISTVIWLLVMLLVLASVYFATKESTENFGTTELASLGRAGKELFEWILFFMLLFVLFIVPGVTSSTITGERERQTLIPLQLTLLSPAEIIVGKLTAALAFLALLMVTTAPLLSVSFLLGGVGILDVLVGLLMVLFTGLVLGSFGMLCSSFFKSTVAATVATYAISLAFFVGLWFMFALFAIFFLGDDGDIPVQFLAFNPLTGVADALPADADPYNSSSPFGAMQGLIYELQEGYYSSGPNSSPSGERSWVWQLYVLMGAGWLALNTWVSTKAISVPAERER